MRSLEFRVKRYIHAFLELKDEVRQDMDYVIIPDAGSTLDFHETKSFTCFKGCKSI